MEDILFERVLARSKQRSILFSELNYPLQSVTFRQCVWMAEADELIPRLKVDNTKNIRFIDCTTQIAGDTAPFPPHLIYGPSEEAVRLE